MEKRLTIIMTTSDTASTEIWNGLFFIFLIMMMPAFRIRSPTASLIPLNALAIHPISRK